MKLSTKILIDKIVGRIFLVPLSVVLSLVPRRKHQALSSDYAGVILITKYQGMGSLVLASAAISRLRESLPKAKLVFMGTAPTVGLAKRLSCFDEFLVLDERSLWSSCISLISNLIAIRKLKVDIAVDLEPYSLLATAINFLTMARRRVGFLLYTNDLRKNMYSDLVYMNRFSYLARAYWQLVGVLMPEAFVQTNLSLQIKSFQFEDREVGELPSQYIVFNIHASDLSFERKWKRESFESLARKFLSEFKQASVVLIGAGKSEVVESKKFFTDPRVVDLTGKLDFDQMMSVLKKAQLVVTNDSGPLHFAMAAQSKLIGLFGPTHPEAYLPVGNKNVRFLSSRMYCSPCVHHWDRTPCKGNNICMDELQWQRVWNEAIELLEAKPLDKLPILSSVRVDSYYPGSYI